MAVYTFTCMSICMHAHTRIEKSKPYFFMLTRTFSFLIFVKLVSFAAVLPSPDVNLHPAPKSSSQPRCLKKLIKHFFLHCQHSCLSLSHKMQKNGQEFVFYPRNGGATPSVCVTLKVVALFSHVVVVFLSEIFILRRCRTQTACGWTQTTIK